MWLRSTLDITRACMIFTLTYALSIDVLRARDREVEKGGSQERAPSDKMSWNKLIYWCTLNAETSFHAVAPCQLTSREGDSIENGVSIINTSARLPLRRPRNLPIFSHVLVRVYLAYRKEPPTSSGLVATRGLIIDSGMPCVFSTTVFSQDFYPLHNSRAFHMLYSFSYGLYDSMEKPICFLLSLGLATFGLVYMVSARFSSRDRSYIPYRARQSCYAAATFPAPTLDSTAVGAVDNAVDTPVTFAAFVDNPIFLTVTVPQ